MTKKSSFIKGGVALCIGGAVITVPARGTPQIIGSAVTIGLLGDVNGDGIANGLDLSIVQSHLNAAGGLAQGDFDGNGLVDTTDLTLLNTNLMRHRASVYIGKIADTTTTVPGAANTFSGFNNAVMDKSGTIAMVGLGSPTNGVYKYTSGVLSKVADNSTVIPGASGVFASFGLPSINKGKVAFLGYDLNSKDGIYTDRSGTLTKVVDRNNGFSGFGDPNLSDTGAAFIGLLGTASGIYNWSFASSSIATVTLSANTIPAGTGSYTGFGSVSSDGTTVYHGGTGLNQSGIYKEVGGVSSVVVDRNSLLPGSSATFAGGSIANVSRDGDNISFNATEAGRSSILARINNVLSMVADTSTPVPDGSGLFSKFSYSSVGGSSVAFVGYDAVKDSLYPTGHPGLYAWTGSELARLVDTSMTLNGKLIRTIELAQQSVNANKVVFKAIFRDNTTGIFVASLIPTPVPGDINEDGVTNSADFRILFQHMNSAGGWAQGDLDGNGIVDFTDYQIMERNLGRVGQTTLTGDADGDGKVNSADFKVLYNNMGKYGTIAQGDFDGDGKITFNDYQLFELQNGKTTSVAYTPFGASVPLGAEALPGDVVPAPEPGSLALLTLAATSLLGRRSRRHRV